MIKVGDRFKCPHDGSIYTVMRIFDNYVMHLSDQEPGRVHSFMTNPAALASNGWILLDEYDLIHKYNTMMEKSYD